MRILVVEDEKKVASFIKKGLQEEGYAVDMVHDGQEALVNAAAFDYDLLILDLMLPKLAGLEVLREIRAKKRNLPVLVLTAKGALDDKVAGLDAGADDYLTKPFPFRVLLARLRAISRRSDRPAVARLQVDDLVLDPASHQVTRAGKAIALTATEYRLLEFLMRRAGRALSRSAIIEGVWGFEEDVEANTVDVFIRLLREKLDAGHERRMIQTVRGYGYILREDG